MQNRYLGPPGRTLIFQARYSAYAMWVGYAFLFVIVRAQLGLFRGGLGYVVVAIAAVLATLLTMRAVTPERPVAQVLRMFGAELGAPRPPRPGPATVMIADPRRVRVSATRPRPRQDYRR